MMAFRIALADIRYPATPEQSVALAGRVIAQIVEELFMIADNIPITFRFHGNYRAFPSFKKYVSLTI